MQLIKLFFLLPLLFIMACSVAYDEVKKVDIHNPKTFQQHLLFNYKEQASFEAEKMHDWNSAKLYSEKALKAKNGENIYPEKIQTWKIAKGKIKDITSSYNNLLSIYDEALIKDPKNLAKAISSLDCWAEQEEEKWQTWDIEKCKNSFHNAMHSIYNNLSNTNDSKKNKAKSSTEKQNEKQITIVTQNEKKEVMQIIYFDYDHYLLSEVSQNTLKNFLYKHKKDLSKFIILGHTDTMGTNNYNLKLSLKRAETVKQMLLEAGISEKNVSIFGKGENDLAVRTPDNTKHPANRRAEVKILN